MFEHLTRVEREVYELILRAGEVMTKDISFKKAGAVPSLVRKGLVEVYKRPVSAMSEKRLKFLRVKKTPEEKQAEP